jgi:hypothetical protein
LRIAPTAFRDAADLFDSAAVTFPRSDYRPSWLYWSARANDQLGDAATANARYRLIVADYQNSYYGRLAMKLLDARKQPTVAPLTTVTACDEVRASDRRVDSRPSRERACTTMR